MRKDWRTGLAVVICATLSSIGACGHRDRSSAVAHLTSAHLGDLSANGRSRLTATFFGASTVLISDGSSALLIDGFLTRPSKAELLTSRLRPDEFRISTALPTLDGQRLEAILVAHAHHDHVLDASSVARRFQSTVYGSHAVGQIVRAEGLDSASIVEVEDGAAYRLGSFRVAAIRTPHSPDDPADGDVSPSFTSPSRVFEYRGGQNFSFLVQHQDAQLLIVPSANFEPGAFANYRAEVVFLSVGRLGQQSDAFIERYWCETVQRTGATLVVPTHWDDFSQPLSRPLPITPRPLDDVERAFSRLAELARRDAVVIYGMDAFDTLSLDHMNELTGGGAPLLSQTCDR